MKKQRSHIVEGDDLLPLFKRAITEASTQQSICRITHKKHQAAIISAKWIPLIMKLVDGTFKKSEINLLKEALNAANTPKEASHVLASWAEELM